MPMLLVHSADDNEGLFFRVYEMDDSILTASAPAACGRCAVDCACPCLEVQLRVTCVIPPRGIGW